MHQQGDLRRHIQSLRRRTEIHYQGETERKTHWRAHHTTGWKKRLTVLREPESQSVSAVASIEGCG